MYVIRPIRYVIRHFYIKSPQINPQSIPHKKAFLREEGVIAKGNDERRTRKINSFRHDIHRATSLKDGGIIFFIATLHDLMFARHDLACAMNSRCTP